MSVEDRAHTHAEPHASQAPESPAVDIPRVLATALAVLLLLGGTVVVLDAVYVWQVPERTMPPPQLFPEPRVATGEPEQLRRIVAGQRKRLSEYRWANEQHTIVQIPIERAMQMIASAGPNAYAPLAPTSALQSPTAGAERIITPPEQTAPATMGAGSQGPAGPSPTASSPGRRP